MSRAEQGSTGPGQTGRGQTGRGQAGATRDESNRKKRRPLWLWLLLGLLVLGLLLFALSRCGGPSSSATGGQGAPPPAAGTPTAAPSDASAAATPDAGAGGGAQAGAGSGTLTAAGTSLLPVAAVSGPNGELTTQVGQPASSAGATVQSVPADEGFWVGTSETDRVWVALTGEAGESGYTVQPGDQVDFTGQVVAHDAGFAEQSGVDTAEGAELLTAQAAHIEVAKSELRGTTG